MTLALFDNKGIRFLTEKDIRQRDWFVGDVFNEIKEELTTLNKAWTFWRVEGPCLIPGSDISDEYGDSDIFITNHKDLVLRPETTKSSYEYARHIVSTDKRASYPLCVWQLGKSFRREVNDGARPSKLRYNEFYQLEFQCIYSIGSKCDYLSSIREVVRKRIESFTNLNASVVKSDRTPSYSMQTWDIEVGNIEMCSISERKDFSDRYHVLEIAIGIDRILDIRKLFG